jgi:alkylation response protein AidB-like acyl-CoA dehydrogenase
MDFSLTPKHRKIYETVGELGRTRFAPRAAKVDHAARSPVENLKDLYDAGFAGAALREEIGGLGGGALGTDPLASLLVVEQTARYCLSTASASTSTTIRPTASTRSALANSASVICARSWNGARG